MAFEVQGRNAFTRVATDDLVAYTAVVLDSVGEAAIPAAGARCFGVVQMAVDNGKPAPIMTDGISKMVAGAVITLPAQVTCDNQGRAVPATTGDFVIGEALLAAGAAGRIISVRLGAEHKAQA